MRWIAILLVIGLAGCDGDRPSAGAPTETSGLSQSQLGFLKFAPVERIRPTELADLSGTIEFDEQHTARLNAVVPGRVAELLVQVGDHVEANQPLLAIDSAEVKVAQADWVREDADLLLARRASERADRLRAAGAIADKDYLQAKEDLKKAEAEFERAQAQLTRLGVTSRDTESRYLLRAPFAGTVVERRALVGTEAGPEGGEPLVVVSDLRQLRVVLRLPERELPLVSPGQQVGVRVDAYPEEFEGVVAAVGDVVDEATRTVPVRCALPNPDRRLKPAMFARVALKAPSGLELTAVPTSAVLSDGRSFRVVVKKPDGGLEVRQVELGAQVGGQVEVLKGLAVGDSVVIEGALLAEKALADAS